MDSYHHHQLDNNETYLPPGFRFHPTDEELIIYYLLKKVLDSNFSGRAIAEVDLNKCEPWELPGKAKMGEKEWYFFSLRDRKYPTGLRTNRATEAGYWKATGKDREIYSSKTCALVGMKKTLVFYRGRAPKGEKSNWVMHEYRLEGKFAYHYLSRSSKDEWVISRVFQKCGGGATTTTTTTSSKKSRLSCNTTTTSTINNHSYPEPSSPSSVSLPPLLDHPSNVNAAAGTAAGIGDSCSYDSHAPSHEHVSCFSTIAAAASAAASATAFNHNHHHPTFDLSSQPPPAPSMINSAARNTGMSAFPSLRSLQENLQLPFFFSAPSSMSPPFSNSTWPMMHDNMGGGVSGVSSFGGANGNNGGSSSSRMALGSTELDCMWTY